MTICYFGDYDPCYSRNRVILKGLKRQGVNILFCLADQKLGFWQKVKILLKTHKKIKNEYDLMIVGYSEVRLLTILAKLISNKPVVWDAFYSKYDVWVNDKKVVKPKTIKAFYHWAVEWSCCFFADTILLDTNTYIDYFVKTFKSRKKKFIRVLIGADNDIFYPRANIDKQEKEKFIVHFHGKFIPVQGVLYILWAANILKPHKDIFFQLIGSGQDYKAAKKIVDDRNLYNVKLYGYEPYEKFIPRMAKADISLGNFGNSDKVLRVVANKSYETIAMGMPLLSADAPAMREVFTNRRDVLFCQRANPKDLAEKILELKGNKALRENIAKNGYQIFNRLLTPDLIGAQLIKDLKTVLKLPSAIN